jgi:7-cyano-7-deazaguanine reductase
MTDYSVAAETKTETVENPNIVTFPSHGQATVVEWEYAEFQCLCPVSGRHDQGVVRLSYLTKEKILESKSVRDYFASWRNKRIWQEYVTNELANTLYNACEPAWLVLEIEWAARGGISAKTIAKRGEI